MFVFEDATKEKCKLRLALIGPTGSGKTFSALKIATAMSSKIGCIDTENNSASKYSDKFSFKRINLTNHHPENYIQAIHAAAKAGLEVLIIDSLSHAWMGKDGALELKDKAAKRTHNDFTAWRDVSPLHNQLVEAILGSPCHIIATMRAKMEYVIENVNGKTTVKKLGLEAIQRDGVSYEFDVIADMNMEHEAVISKTRCSDLDNKIIKNPGEEFAHILLGWVNAGAVPAPKPQSQPQPQPAQNAISQLPAQGQGVDAAASGSASPAQTTLPDANVSHDPKPGAATVESSTSGATSTTPTSATSAESISTSNTNKPQPIAAAPAQVALPEMQALLAAGNSNGWTKDQLLGFMEHVFKGSSTKGLKPDEYRVIYNCVLRPENKNGVAKYNSNGEGLAPNLHFPVAAK